MSEATLFDIDHERVRAEIRMCGWFQGEGSVLDTLGVAAERAEYCADCGATSLGCSFTKRLLVDWRRDPERLCKGPVPGGASVKRISAHGGCLGMSRRRRTWQAAISLGELQASIDPGMSEWGNPAGVISRHPKGSQPGELKHLSTPRKRNQTRVP